MWDLIVSVPDHCLSFYFKPLESMLVQSVEFLRNKTYTNNVDL